MNYEVSFLKALFITIFIETLILWILVRTFEKKKTFQVPVLLITGFFASFATLPYLWFVLPVFVTQRVLYPVLSELFAIFVESFILFGFLKIEFHKCFLFSLACNIVSFSTGLIINNLFPELL
jgi:hypothetical protein